MSTPDGPATPDPRKTLLAHAVELHQREPDKPLPRDGYPFPDDADHRRHIVPSASRSEGLAGVDVAALLDRYFAEAGANPALLPESLHLVHVPLYPSDHIAAAARAAGRDRALETGRWLIRNGTDRCAVTVGLALLEAVGITDEDIGLVQTIGLLSNQFGPLAARALAKLPDKSASALLWLADRVEGWGRVSAVRSLGRLDDPDVRRWLLRKAVDGDYLNGYFAAEVVGTGRLHEVLDEFETDPELVDATGRLLWVMTENEGMGLTLHRYEHAGPVLAAYLRAAARLGPTLRRYFIAAVITRYMGRRKPDDPATAWDLNRSAYRALLDDPTWHDTARLALADGDRRIRYIAEYVAPEIGLVLG